MKRIAKSAPEREPTDAELRAIDDVVETVQTLKPASAASTAIDLVHMGLDQVAYVRRTVIEDLPVWSICSAIGQQIGAAPTLELAWGAIVENDLRPVHVH